LAFLFIPKSTTLNATMFRGKRGFGENMKRGFTTLKKINVSTYFANECRDLKTALRKS